MKYDPKSDPLLILNDLSVSYDNMPVLEHICLTIWKGQIVAIVGPNGAGKTTVLKSIAGIIRPSRGQIILEGKRIESGSVWEQVHRGVVYVPEGMSVFPDMSVLENLEIGAYLNRRMIPQRLEMVFNLFPELIDKRAVRAGVLSGGEQRMVTLARGLMAGARLLLLDDPFLGLSPKIIRRFCEVFKLLRHNGVTQFIAGQHVRRILNVADIAFLIEDGNITLSGPGPEVLQNSHLQRILFGLDTDSHLQ